MKKKLGLVLFIVALLFHSCIQKKDQVDENAVYTCSMDPQVRQNHPGKCPICHMELTKVTGATDKNDHVIRISEAQKELANIKTAFAEPQTLSNEKILNAVVTVNQNLSSAITSRVEGRIEKLYMKSIGEKINKGQVIYELYSEQLIAAQKDYLVSLKPNQSNSAFGFDYKKLEKASRQKLLLWGMNENQINNLKKTHKVINPIPVSSNKSGIISEIGTREGDYVMEGTEIYKLTDFSTVWVEAQLYASEALNLTSNSVGEVTFPAFTDTLIKGNITFTNPELLPNSKFIIARIEIQNPSQIIHPGMQATITIRSDEREALAVPVTAIIHDKQGEMVWLKKSPGAYEPRMVETGMINKLYVEIVSGLEDGDAVVVMKEDGIDISKNPVNDVFDFFKEGKIFHYVITVCDAKASESCPVFPGMMKKINWSFSDPSRFTGSHEEKLEATRKVRDQVKEAVIDFAKSFQASK